MREAPKQYYLPRYMLIKGYKIIVGEANNGRIYSSELGSLRIGREVFESPSEAIACSELLRQDRLISLRKSVAKIEKLEKLNYGLSK